MLLKTQACEFSLCAVREVKQPNRAMMYICNLGVPVISASHAWLASYRQIPTWREKYIKRPFAVPPFQRWQNGGSRAHRFLPGHPGKLWKSYLRIFTTEDKKRNKNSCLVVNACKLISWEAEAIKSPWHHVSDNSNNNKIKYTMLAWNKYN